MMNENKTGPFKKGIENKARTLAPHSLWIAVSLTCIALAQIPIAVKSSLDIINSSAFKGNENTKVFPSE